MPYLQEPEVGTAVGYARSDHAIPIPRPVADSALGVRSACKTCHADMSEAALDQQVQAWYGELKPVAPTIASVLAGRATDDAAAAIPRLLLPDAPHTATQFAGLALFTERHLALDAGTTTDAERRLWSRLRSNRAFRGTFEREVSIGHYVVDFASLPAKLVVEVDDGQITGRRAAEIRAIYLNALGWRVLRIWHSDIDRRPDAILHSISEAMNPAAPPTAEEERPSPIAKAEKKKVAKKKTVAKTKKNKRRPRRESRKKG